MTIKGRVHNRTVVLPPDIDIADGVEVDVIVPQEPAAANGGPTTTPDWLRDALGKATSGLTTDEIMHLTRGDT